VKHQLPVTSFAIDESVHSMKSSGFLIAIEGIDGSGKTTIGRIIDEYMTQKNIPHIFLSSGGFPEEYLVSQIKKIGTNPDYPTAATTEFFLYLAWLSQRANEFIVPALEEGKMVIVDRFEMSGLVLAHYGRGQARDLALRAIEMAACGIKPTLTIICDLEESVAMQRVISKKAILSRKEREGTSLLEKLRRGYLNEAKNVEKGKIVILRTDFSWFARI